MKSAEEVMVSKPIYNKIGLAGLMSEEPGCSTWSIPCDKCAGCQTVFSSVIREESTILPDVFTRCPICGRTPKQGAYVCGCGCYMVGCSLPSGRLIITTLEVQDLIDASEDVI